MVCAVIISCLDYDTRYVYVQTFNWRYSHFILISNLLIVGVLLVALLRYKTTISIRGDQEADYKVVIKRGSVIGLAICVLFEAYTAGVLQNTTLAMNVGCASRASYVDFIRTTQPVVDYIYQNDDGFYRMEKTFFRMANDNMALGIRGVSGSTSTMNSCTLDLLRRLGYSSSSYISWYYGGNPVNDSLIGIKYIISDGRDRQLLPDFYDIVYEDVDNKRYVFENPYSLGLAYAVHSDILYFDPSEVKNPFEYMNAVLSAMLAQNHEIFKPMAVGVLDNTSETHYTVDMYSECEHGDQHQDMIPYQKTFVCRGNGEPLYMYLNSLVNRGFSVYINGTKIELNLPADCSSSITSIGMLEDGEEYEIMICSKYTPIDYSPNQILFYTLDLNEFKRMVSFLQNNQLIISSKSTEDRIVGTVTMSEKYPILFTSIPYDKNWHIYADGQMVQPCMIESSSDLKNARIPVLDAVVAVELTPGDHEIVIEYRPMELLIGTAISLAGVIVLVAIINIEKRKTRRVSEED